MGGDLHVDEFGFQARHGEWLIGKLHCGPLQLRILQDLCNTSENVRTPGGPDKRKCKALGLSKQW